MVQLKAKGKKTKTAIVKPVKIAKTEDKPKQEKLKKNKKAKKVEIPVKPESSEEEEDSEDEEEEVKPNGGKAVAPAVAMDTKEEEDSSDEDEEESDDDEEENTKQQAKEESDDEDDDDDDDDEDDDDDDEDEEETASKAKAVAKADDDDEDDDDDDDDDDSEEDEEEAKPKKAAAKAKKEKKAEEDDDSDDDDDDEEEEEDSDDDDEEEEEEMETEAVSLKRKNKTKEEQAPTKKQKVDDDGEPVTMMFMNLPEGTDDSSFNEFLKSKGIQCVACRANYNRQKAFVDVKKSDMGKALALDQVEWQDSELSVKQDTPRVDRRSSSGQGGDFGGGGFGGNRAERDERTLFAKNLPYQADEGSISDLFEGVREVRLLKDRETGRSKGMAFIEFNSKEEKEAGFGLKDELELDGRSVFIDNLQGGGRGGGGGGRGFGGGRGRGGRDSFGGRGRGGSRGPSTPSKTLFVKGITEDMTKDTLWNSFGSASDIRIPQDRDTGKNKFFAYIEFNSESDATSIYRNAKGGMNVEGNKLYVDYAAERTGGDRGGRGGGRGRGGGGRGGGRGRGGRGGGFSNPKHKGTISTFEGKRTTFNDSD